MKLLITDFAWPDLSIEKRLLEEADLGYVVADSQDEETLAALACLLYTSPSPRD